MEGRCWGGDCGGKDFDLLQVVAIKLGKEQDRVYKDDRIQSQVKREIKLRNLNQHHAVISDFCSSSFHKRVTQPA